uniref:Uncharacterized protein n=1 Tax=Romanomermis culicivorax TaxID=13658 RepID=A0A915JF79_ROMCU
MLAEMEKRRFLTEYVEIFVVVFRQQKIQDRELKMNKYKSKENGRKNYTKENSLAPKWLAPKRPGAELAGAEIAASKRFFPSSNRS